MAALVNTFYHITHMLEIMTLFGAFLKIIIRRLIMLIICYCSKTVEIFTDIECDSVVNELSPF